MTFRSFVFCSMQNFNMQPGFEILKTEHVDSTHNKTKNVKIFFATNARNIVKFKNKIRTQYVIIPPNNVFLPFKCF